MVEKFLQEKLRIRNKTVREFFAEFLGTFLLIVSTRNHMHAHVILYDYMHIFKLAELTQNAKLELASVCRASNYYTCTQIFRQLINNFHTNWQKCIIFMQGYMLHCTAGVISFSRASIDTCTSVARICT